MKFVRQLQKKSRYGQLFVENHSDITISIFMKFKCKCVKPRANVSGIPNFILIWHMRGDSQKGSWQRILKKKDIWPWPSNKGRQFQYSPSQDGKHLFSENCSKIGASVRLEFCSLINIHSNRSENITPPRFFGVKNFNIIKVKFLENQT